MTTRTYDVPEISCGHCKAAIESAVGGVGGVSAVHVDIDAKTVQVDGEVSDDTIRATLDDIGYEVSGVR